MTLRRIAHGIVLLCELGHLSALEADGGIRIVRRYYMDAVTSAATVRDGTIDRPFGSFEEAKAAVRESVVDGNLAPGIGMKRGSQRQQDLAMKTTEFVGGRMNPNRGQMDFSFTTGRQMT